MINTSTLKEFPKETLAVLRDAGVRRYRFSNDSWEVEFFAPPSEPMKLDPASLAKTLGESMPPDSQMMFAATEEIPEPKE